MPSPVRFFVRAAAALTSSVLIAADLTVEKTFASSAAFESFSPDPGIDLVSAPGAITLCSGCATGAVTSPVIDMAATTNRDAITPLFKIRSLDIQWRAISPGAASVKIEARSGSTVWPDDTWSPWTGVDRALPARFVQVRAALGAGRDGVAPSLARLTLSARGECVATPDSQGYALRDFRRPPAPEAEAADAPRLLLTCTETPGVLAVSARAGAPALKAFRFAPSGQTPVLLPGDGTEGDSRRVSYAWQLTPGPNTLSVTILDTADRDGQAATVSVDWKQPPPPNPEQP